MQPDDLVYAVDDDKDFLESLKSMLESAGFRVSAFTDARKLIEALELRPRSCIISDIRMPGMDGVELQRVLAQRGFRIPIVFVTAYGDVPLAINAMKSGVVDFIEKPIDETLLIEGISRALEASRVLWERIHAEQRAQALIATLSGREMEVFRFLAQGLQNAAISERLGISARTVEVHRANLYKKLDVKNLAAVVRLALLAGIASPTDLFSPPAD
jgi:two-component system, LuxR family, response regulator FixJ